MKLTFKKGEAVKLVEEGSDLISILKKDGWKEDKPEVKPKGKK